MAAKRSRIIVVVVAIATIGGIVAFNVIKDRRKRVDVRTEPVGLMDLTATVSASGEDKPKRFVIKSEQGEFHRRRCTWHF